MKKLIFFALFVLEQRILKWFFLTFKTVNAIKPKNLTHTFFNTSWVPYNFGKKNLLLFEVYCFLNFSWRAWVLFFFLLRTSKPPDPPPSRVNLERITSPGEIKRRNLFLRVFNWSAVKMKVNALLWTIWFDKENSWKTFRVFI